MEFILWSMINLPIILTIIGVVFFAMYLYNRLVKQRHIKSFFIIACVSIGLVLLSFAMFIIIGATGIGPVPN